MSELSINKPTMAKLTEEVIEEEQREQYIDNVTTMLSRVTQDRGSSNSSHIVIVGLLTDKYEPSVIYTTLYKACSIINLKEFIINKENHNFRDINVIRLTNILLEIINDKTISSRAEEFRELALSTDRYNYNFDSNQDPYTVPSMYIEDLQTKLTLPDTNYILSTHIDKIISSIGYISLGMFIDINKYSFGHQL